MAILSQREGGYHLLIPQSMEWGNHTIVLQQGEKAKAGWQMPRGGRASVTVTLPKGANLEIRAPGYHTIAQGIEGGMRIRHTAHERRPTLEIANEGGLQTRLAELHVSQHVRTDGGRFGDVILEDLTIADELKVRNSHSTREEAHHVLLTMRRTSVGPIRLDTDFWDKHLIESLSVTPNQSPIFSVKE